MGSMVPGEIASVDDIRRQAKQNFGQPERAPHLAHKDLLAMAKANPPKEVVPTVSSFADWVFGLDKQSTNDEAAKDRGREGELVVVDGVLRDLAQLRSERWERIQAKKKFDMAYYATKRFPGNEWELEFNGTGASDIAPLEITALRVSKQPLLAKPDLVFRHQRSGDVLIVELNGQGRLPPFGWPNLKVQLWCYGMIDLWRDAPNIFLQAWVWRWIRRPGLNQPEADSGLQHPGIVLQPWLSRDPRVHSESVELFEAFGVAIAASLNPSIRVDLCAVATR